MVRGQITLGGQENRGGGHRGWGGAGWHTGCVRGASCAKSLALDLGTLSGLRREFSALFPSRRCWVMKFEIKDPTLKSGLQ